jgi:hypothetical protein
VNARVTPPSGPPGTRFTLDAFGFQPGEGVGVWLTAPNQATFGADFQATADSSGSIAGEEIGIETDSSYQEGIWSFNAQGIESSRQAIGYFLISRITGAAPGNPANLGVPIHDQLPSQGRVVLVPVAAPVGTPFTFTAAGFAADDEIDAWYTGPDKRSTPIEIEELIRAGDVIEFDFSSIGLPEGFYTVAAQGSQSKTIVSASFKLTSEFLAPPGTPRPSNVNGSITPAEGGNNTVFQLRGQGLRPGERLQFWTTAPDGAYVLYPDELSADSQGRIGYEPPLDLYGTGQTLPGVYGFHFRGRSSGVRVDLYLTYTGQATARVPGAALTEMLPALPGWMAMNRDK